MSKFRLPDDVLIAMLMREPNLMPDAHKQIAAVIGIGPMVKLCGVYGGNQIYIPTIGRFMRAQRDALIYKDHAAGKSLSQLAAKFNLTTVTVRQILKKAEA